MVKVPLGYFCSFACSISHAKKKVYKQKEKQQKQELKQRKEAIKTKPKLVAEAETAVRAYIRVRDHGRPCISCGATPSNKPGGSMDAGHYRSKGSAPHLRFNTYNIHSQCVKCNRYNSGNVNDYRIGLINKIGIDRVISIEGNNEIRRYEREYLVRMKKVFSKRTRHLRKIRGY